MSKRVFSTRALSKPRVFYPAALAGTAATLGALCFDRLAVYQAAMKHDVYQAGMPQAVYQAGFEKQETRC